MDFLGLKNLTVINKTLQMLKEREGVDVDWDKIHFIDPKTYESLGEGHTLGVFQLESDGLTALVKRLKPTTFSDLTALIALYRPGPLDQGMHHVFVDRKHGREKVVYDHPVLEQILKETYGVILYQEQVMLISQKMCGFTGGEADTLRKAMGKKKQDVMDKMYPSFIEGAAKICGVQREVADKIWNNIVTFARYGFNKSHSAAYAVVTFQTAYLRAHWPTYFLAALLTNEISGSTDGIAKYVADCREAGIRVLPVDINRSREYFNPDPDGIWYALNGVKGVGTGFAQAVVRERDANGPFRSLQDFCLRVPREEVNSRMIEALIKVGAFDGVQPNRAALIGVLPEVMALAAEYQRDRNSGQEDLFAAAGEEGSAGVSIIEEVPLPPLPEWDMRERAASEKEHLGFYLSDHPLKRFAAEMEAFTTIRSGQMEARAAKVKENQREAVAFLAYISDVVVRTDKNGNPWGIVLMEDFDGPFECKFFSRAFEQCRAQLQPDAVVHVQGQLSMWSGRVSLEGNSVRLAEELRADAKGLELAWQDTALTEQALWQLKELCRRTAGPGSKPLRLAILHGAEVMAQFTPGAPWKVPTTSAILESLRELPGTPRVRLLAPETLLGAPERKRFGS
jgi:DNA polymerase-3 subunit alpha